MNIIIVLSLCHLLSGAERAGQVYDLRQAVKGKLVSYQASYNPGSTHYSNPILIKVNNISGKEIKVKIPAGYLFVPNDSNTQPQVVVKEELLALMPGEQKRLTLQAMCTNAGKSGPSGGIQYLLADGIDKKLIQVAEFLDKKKYHGIEAQCAIWSYTNGNSLTQINGPDTLAAAELRLKLSEITGRPAPGRDEMNQYKNNFYAPVSNPQVRISGKIEFEFNRSKNIAIAIFNRNNVVVRELFRNAETQPGPHTVEYVFDSSVYTEDFYRIVLIGDGKVMMKREMDMKKYKRI